MLRIIIEVFLLPALGLATCVAGEYACRIEMKKRSLAPGILTYHFKFYLMYKLAKGRYDLPLYPLVLECAGILLIIFPPVTIFLWT